MSAWHREYEDLSVSAPSKSNYQETAMSRLHELAARPQPWREHLCRKESRAQVKKQVRSLMRLLKRMGWKP